MKKILLIAVLCFLTNGVMAAKNGGSHYVSGYTTKSGNYVPPHHATNPNNTKNDNWSTRGNVNPHTGKPGTKNPD